MRTHSTLHESTTATRRRRLPRPSHPPEGSGSCPSERSSASRSPPTQYSRITHRWFWVSYLWGGAKGQAGREQDVQSRGVDQKQLWGHKRVCRSASGGCFHGGRRSVAALAHAHPGRAPALLCRDTVCDAGPARQGCLLRRGLAGCRPTCCRLMKCTHQVWKRSMCGWVIEFSTLTCARGCREEPAGSNPQVCRHHILLALLDRRRSLTSALLLAAGGLSELCSQAATRQHPPTSCRTRGLASLAHALTATYSRLCFSRALYTLLARPLPMISWMLQGTRGRAWAPTVGWRRRQEAPPPLEGDGHSDAPNSALPHDATAPHKRSVAARAVQRAPTAVPRHRQQRSKAPRGSLIIIHAAGSQSQGPAPAPLDVTARGHCFAAGRAAPSPRVSDERDQRVEQGVRSSGGGGHWPKLGAAAAGGHMGVSVTPCRTMSLSQSQCWPPHEEVKIPPFA